MNHEYGPTRFRYSGVGYETCAARDAICKYRYIACTPWPDATRAAAALASRARNALARVRAFASSASNPGLIDSRARYLLQENRFIAERSAKNNQTTDSQQKLYQPGLPDVCQQRVQLRRTKRLCQHRIGPGLQKGCHIIVQSVARKPDDEVGVAQIGAQMERALNSRLQHTHKKGKQSRDTVTNSYASSHEANKEQWYYGTENNDR